MSDVLSLPKRNERARFLAIAKRVLTVAVLAACAWGIATALKGQSLASISTAFAAIPSGLVLIGATLIALNFGVMTLMELLALRDAGVGLTLGRAALSSFVGNALSLAAGLGPISGAGVRAGLFQRWGLPVHAAAATALSATLMSLAGGATLAATGLTLQPQVIAYAFGLPAPLLRGCGITFLVVLAAMLFAAGRRRVLFSVPGAAISAPSGAGAILRLGLGAIDWIISANVLYLFVSMGAHAAPLAFVSTFASAHFAGMAVGAPAGLGVFDTLILHDGAINAEPAALAAALLLYRLVGYATPALLAIGPYLYLTNANRRGDASA